MFCRRYVRIFIGFALLLLVGISGCRSYENTVIKVHRLDPLIQDTASSSMEAGLARVDITPPPGIAVAGYSAMASKCTGFRNKLHARVAYFRSADGEAVALVQSDLLAGSRLVHHRVAELIAPYVDVPINGLMIAGTHTHSGPGNFFGNNFYNKFASSAKGLDKELYHFLSSRIADAVIEAYKNRRPAKIAVGTTEIPDVTRNRSMGAFQANFLEEADDESDRVATVNSVMTMIRIDLQDDDGQYRPAGAFSSFSIHPTAVPYWNTFYNADVFGYIARELEFELEQGEESSWQKVHAAVNGAHGDNSPGYEPGKQGFIEAKRIGLTIGRQAVSLFDSLGSDLCSDVKVASACREVDLYQAGEINDVSICSRPVVGNALTGGAEDGKTPVLNWMPFFHEGWGTSRWLFTGACQGHKRHIGSFFQPLILNKKDFPHRLFLQVLQVGEVTLLPFPFEVTCQAGREISQAVAREAGENQKHAVVISCANGYFGYSTTPAEYSKQHYEGGHTLYGPNTNSFLTEHALGLLSEMKEKGSPDLPAAWDFNLKATTYFPEKKTCLGNREEVRQPVFEDAAKNTEPFWTYCWRDVPPSAIDFHKPLIQIQTSDDGVNWQELIQDGRKVNDDGYDVSVNYLKLIKDQQMGVYEARWYNPEIPPGSACRFVVLERQGQEILYSSVFK